MIKNQNKNNPSQEFDERKELIRLDLDCAKQKHKLKMDEMKYMRESDKLHHEMELERGRIKSAEIRKTLYQKEMARRD